MCSFCSLIHFTKYCKYTYILYYMSVTLHRQTCTPSFILAAARLHTTTENIMVFFTTQHELKCAIPVKPHLQLPSEELFVTLHLNPYTD